MKVITVESIEGLLEQLEREIDKTIEKRVQCQVGRMTDWEQEDKRLLGHAAARLHVRNQLREVLETAVSHWDIEEELVVEPPDSEVEQRDSGLCARCGDPIDCDNHRLYCAGRGAYKLD